jgi:hypothetical protein
MKQTIHKSVSLLLAVILTITTGADGKAQSKQLYLGDYQLVETKTAEPYSLARAHLGRYMKSSAACSTPSSGRR